jgi:hypothetical protein
MCKICESLGKDDLEWRKYFDLRASTIQSLTDLRVSLFILKNSPIEKSGLEDVLEKMKSLQSVDKDALPMADELSKMKLITKIDLPPVNPELSSRAKAVAEINEDHLEEIVKQLNYHKPIVETAFTDKNGDTILTVRALIFEAKQRYTELQIGRAPMDESYEKVSPTIRQLYLRNDCKNTIGIGRSEELIKRLASLYTLVGLYSEAKQLMIDSDIQKYGTKGAAQFEKIMQLLYSIELSLPVVVLEHDQ